MTVIHKSKAIQIQRLSPSIMSNSVNPYQETKSRRPNSPHDTTTQHFLTSFNVKILELQSQRAVKHTSKIKQRQNSTFLVVALQNNQSGRRILSRPLWWWWWWWGRLQRKQNKIIALVKQISFRCSILHTQRKKLVSHNVSQLRPMNENTYTHITATLFAQILCNNTLSLKGFKLGHTI